MYKKILQDNYREKKEFTFVTLSPLTSSEILSTRKYHNLKSYDDISCLSQSTLSVAVIFLCHEKKTEKMT